MIMHYLNLIKILILELYKKNLEIVFKIMIKNSIN